MPADDPLLSAYRIIRRLDAPSEAPWPALLAHDADGPVLLVDLTALGDDWPGWRASRDGHLVGASDLVRQAGGHYAAFPPFGGTVDDFLTRRDEAGLSDGECLTLAVSGLRGLAEAGFLPEGPRGGGWWLTDAGRPVFAFHGEGESIAEATRALLEDVRAIASPSLAAVVAEAIDVAAEPSRLARSLPRLEEALFSIATPEPLATTVFAPRRARAVAAGEAAAPHAAEAPEPTLLSRLAMHVDADLADAFSRATTAAWRRFRREGAPSRTKPLVAAGLVAGVVLTGGLLWPSGGPATAGGGSAPSPSASASASAADAAETTTTDSPSTDASASVDPSAEGAEAATPEPAGLEATLERLLTSRASCDDDGCRAALQESPQTSFPAGVIGLPSAERTVTLLDEFGGAAVLRVDAASGDQPSQLVVIVRRNETWVLRDVHDVAEHPR